MYGLDKLVGQISSLMTDEFLSHNIAFKPASDKVESDLDRISTWDATVIEERRNSAVVYLGYGALRLRSSH